MVHYQNYDTQAVKVKAKIETFRDKRKRRKKNMSVPM